MSSLDPAAVETVARAICDSDYETVGTGWPKLDEYERGIYRRLAAAAIAALPPSPAEEAVKRVEVVCDGLEAEMRSMPLTTRMASGALALGLSASRVRAALASPAPAPQGEEGQR